MFHAQELGSYAQGQGSLAVFKVTARDQGHYKGHSGAFVTYCNISFFSDLDSLSVCQKLPPTVPQPLPHRPDSLSKNSITILHQAPSAPPPIIFQIWILCQFVKTFSYPPPPRSHTHLSKLPIFLDSYSSSKQIYLPLSRPPPPPRSTPPPQ